MQLVETQLNTNMNAQGILIDGFPRDIDQVHQFEDKFKQQPNLVLLDCSKLQLGRGRLDDSIAAFRKRLELFREVTLPMLKTLDNENRLSIVDGDTDSPQVQDTFCRLVAQQIDHLKKSEGLIVPDNQVPSPRPPRPLANGGVAHHSQMANGMANGYPADATIHDLEVDEEPTPVHMNGYGPAGPAISDISRTVAAYQQTTDQSGGLFGGPTLPREPPARPSRETIRNMYAQVDRYPMDSNI